MKHFLIFVKKKIIRLYFFITLNSIGSFIIYYLLTHNFKHVEKKEEIDKNTFTTLISDLGQFYSITVYFEKQNKHYKKVTFIDSLKIIPFSVSDTAKGFNLPISKLELDYNTPRELGHILTEHEKDYIKNDVLIMAEALEVLFRDNLEKMTIGSNALSDFKKILTKSKFEHLFPKLDYDIDKDLRKAYKGGFTYLNPIYKEKDVNNITVLDVNSLYPSPCQLCMKNLFHLENLYFFKENIKRIKFILYIFK